MNEIVLNREDFINQYPPLNLLNKADVGSMFKEDPYNIYIHIPFCGIRCDFCYYKTFPTFQYNKGIPSDYLDALINEIKIGIEKYSLFKRECHTIYVGGGTPTLMSCDQIERLFDCLENHLRMSDNFEICVEVRPGMELTEDKLRLLQERNVTRISMGCQSLNDEVLKINGRTHNRKMFIKAYECIKDFEFPVVNVDLMSGLCGENEKTFNSTMKEIVELEPQSITIYKLELYLNSILYRKAKENNYSIMTNCQEAEMVKGAYNYLLNSGYQLSDNFSFISDPKYEHVHRVATWFGEDMIGFGLSAHSRKGYYLYQNENRLEKYYENINNGNLSIQRAYKFTPYENMVREMVFAVKKSNYDMKRFLFKFGIDALDIFGKQLEYLQRNGYIEISNCILQTTLDGMIYADDIVRIFYPDKQKKFELAHLRRN